MPDSETTIDSLREVTAAPPQNDEEEKLEAEEHGQIVFEPIECSPYLVITARGTGEPVKGQLLSPVARTISEARPDDVTIFDLDYPADTEMKVGATAGVGTLIEALNVQTVACPEQQFVLLGYSQGALIVSDALSASGVRVVGEGFGEFSESASEHIAAIVLYGNPRFSGQEVFNAGSFTPNLNGILSREVGILDAYTDRMRDYCVAKDFVCQFSQSLDEEGHVAYFENGMQQDGAAFAITKLAPLE